MRKLITEKKVFIVTISFMALLFATTVVGETELTSEIAQGQNSPYYYYYFKHKQPLQLNVTKIALLQRSVRTIDVSHGKFEKFGIQDADIESWPIPGWALAKTPVSVRSVQEVKGLILQIAEEKTADFISPLFSDQKGNRVIITQNIFVGFSHDITHERVKKIIAKYKLISDNYSYLRRQIKFPDIRQRQ